MVGITAATRASSKTMVMNFRPLGIDLGQPTAMTIMTMTSGVALRTLPMTTLKWNTHHRCKPSKGGT